MGESGKGRGAKRDKEMERQRIKGKEECEEISGGGEGNNGEDSW